MSAAVATAENNIERIVRVNIADGAQIQSTNNKVFIMADSGEKDEIVTRAYVDSKGLAAIGHIKANADINAYNEVIIGKGVNIQGKDIVQIYARFMSAGDRTNWDKDGKGVEASSGTAGYKPGITTEAIIDSKGGVPVPKAITNTNLNVNNYIGVNRKPTVKEGEEAPEIKNTSITSTNGTLTLAATTEKTTVYDNARALGKGAAGVANATAWIKADLANTVWLDNATLRGYTDTIIRADNGTGRDRTHLIANSYTELKALTGKVAPTTRISGLQQNQIRSSNTGKVNLQKYGPHMAYVEGYGRIVDDWGRVTYGPILEYKQVNGWYEVPDENHASVNPQSVMWIDKNANYKRWQKKVFGVTITLTRANVTNRIEVGAFDRCDFCGSGEGLDIDPTTQAQTMEERYQDAYDRALAALNVIEAMARTLCPSTKPP